MNNFIQIQYLEYEAEEHAGSFQPACSSISLQFLWLQDKLNKQKQHRSFTEGTNEKPQAWDPPDSKFGSSKT